MSAYKNNELRRELLARAARDQQARKTWTDTDKIDTDNTRWLATVLETSGWPTKSRVGADGERAAWLLAQHADHDHDFQQECLYYLIHAVANNEASPAGLAYLHDRIQIGLDLPQLFGTQINDDGEPHPLLFPASVDDWRAGVSLEPLADYLTDVLNMRQDRGNQESA